MTSEQWEQIDQLYHATLEVGDEERTVFLDKACAGDAGLREEVELLLAMHGQAGGFLGKPAVEEVVQEIRQGIPLLIGQQWGSYQLLELLGAGGMGEVYKAQDTRLGRQVAIKMLPPAFSASPLQLARFEREARLLAALNHPNIAAIHGFEEAEGKQFLVLELVEGETLAERLSRGPLPLEEALEICRQIAGGMEAAHEKGIIHRDLKPANLKITPEGKVKILDFGVAKAYQAGGSAADLSRSPELTDEMAVSGVILGTAAYMSPEQATGKPADRRTDIWAFGCILYECLTGKRAFQGDTATETLAAILERQPDWQTLPAGTPGKVKELLYRCLQKDPRQRLHDIADVRIEIGEALVQPAEMVSTSRGLSLRRLAPLGALLLIVGVLVGVGLMKYRKPASPTLLVKSVIKLEPGQCLEGMRRSSELERPSRTAMAISRDGRFIVYCASPENATSQEKARLYLRLTEQLEARPIKGTEGGISPFLSPDDRWVGFWADGKLMKVSIDGGVPVTLCDARGPFGASWGDDNRIVYADGRWILSMVPAEGGKPEILTIPDKAKEEVSHRLPHCLPAGKGILFTIMRDEFALQSSIGLLNLKTRRWRILLENAADARYISAGHLVFLRQGTLMVVPFDLSKLEVTGQPVPAITNVMQALNITNGIYNTAAGQFSCSDSGWLVYVEGGIVPDDERSIVWVDLQGKAQPFTTFKVPVDNPRLSPDGQRITHITGGKEWRLWVYDLIRGTASRLTGEGRSIFVIWTPDGNRVVFNWWKSGLANLYWQPADGSSDMERLTTSNRYQAPGSISPDGFTLAFAELYASTTRWDIQLLDLQSRRVTPFLNSPAEETHPEFSSDGHWMAYVSNESGQREVYVRPFPGPGGKWLISREEGIEPLWARNGKQLFYRSLDREQVWAVDVETHGHFSAGRPRLLFKAKGFNGGLPMRGWDISADGQRFLMVQMGEKKPQPVTEMILVMNWSEELKRLAPTGEN